jgi:hypothetical protein
VRLLPLGAAICVALCSLPSPSAASDARETDVKAAFLVNFARYVEWPDDAFESADSPIVIGVLTETSLPEAVEKVSADRRIKSRPVLVKGFADASVVTICHLLFIGADREEQARDAMKRLDGAPVFSIADYGSHGRYDTMANFVRQGKKIRFEIDDRRARRAGIKVSSRLLRLGR